MEYSWIVFDQYMETHSDLYFYTDKLPVIFFKGDGNDIILAKALPSTTILVSDTYRAEKKPADEIKIIEEVATYLGDTPIPEEGFVFLVNRNTNQLVYCYNDGNIVNWDEVSFIPPRDTKLVSLLLFYEHATTGAYVPVKMFHTCGKESALYVRDSAEYLIKPTKTCHTYGTLLMSYMFCAAYNLVNMDPPVREWAIHADGTECTPKEQLLALDSFKEKMRKKGFLAGPINPGIINMGDDEIAEGAKVAGGLISLSWIYRKHTIPKLKSPHWIKLDIAFDIPESSMISEMSCTNGRLCVYVKVGTDFILKRFCERLGISVDSVSVVYVTGGGV